MNTNYINSYIGHSSKKNIQRTEIILLVTPQAWLKVEKQMLVWELKP